MNSSILSRIRHSKAFKAFCAFTAVNFIAESVAPTTAWALTSGPSQPEVQSFEPIGTTDMVNLFSGDFVYNIPLFELPGPNGGYPFNLAYHSGIGMDQEASWVGLGWNLNPGAINRSMRGLPDDFNGDEILKTVDSKPSETWGGTISAPLGNVEISGLDLGLEVGLGLTIFNNNYKGIGYNLSPNIGFKAGSDSKSDGTLEMGLGASFGSQDGVGANLNFSLSRNDYDLGNRYSLGLGFSSKAGLDLNTSITRTGLKVSERMGSDGDMHLKFQKPSNSVSSSFSFGTPSYTPAQSNPMYGTSFSYTQKGGFAAQGFFSNLALNGFYNEQFMVNAGKQITRNGFGYHYLQNANKDDNENQKLDNSDITDFNRGKEGPIYATSPNLPVPNLTYDYYNVQGQGVGGMFRPYRSEVGTIHDPEVHSTSIGESYGTDVGPTDHGGFNAVISNSKTRTGAWTDDNDLWNYYQFQDASAGVGVADYEPVYYKMHGENTSFSINEMTHIGNGEAVRAPMVKESNGLNAPNYKPQTGQLESNFASFNSGITNRRGNDRMSRNMAVQPLTNGEILEYKDDTDPNDLTDEIIGEYQVDHFVKADLNNYQAGPGTELNRETRNNHKIKSHYAGFTVNGVGGQRYVYGLPMYNISDEERIYSTSGQSAGECGPNIPLPDLITMKDKIGADILEPKYGWDGTNEFFSKTEMPPYAHAYGITSILGGDYVDVLNDGPSDDDYGYWVKFNYIQTNDDYRWRSPFAGARYMEGYESDLKDNMASFKTGERETYHLATAETKTHIAVFKMSPRVSDGFGAASTFNQLNGTVSLLDASNPSYQLDQIDLFLKTDFQTQGNNAPALSTVHFQYKTTGKLCNGVLNGAGGKLTLEKLWMTNREDGRGALSPYEFHYDDGITETASELLALNTYENPSYNENVYDRWGNYKGVGAATCDNMDFPYVEQFDRNVNQDDIEKENFRKLANGKASAWHLKQIELPTGGLLKIEYESDDYAYVQHRKALQMFKLSSVGDIDPCNPNNEEDLYPGDHTSTGAPTDAELGVSSLGRRLYFDLENPVKANSNAAQTIRDQYLESLIRDGRYQLFYKTKINLRDAFWEHISGYAELEMDPDPLLDYYGGDCQLTFDPDGDGTSHAYYTKGYLTLKKQDIGGAPVEYHPLAVAAWQSMRINYPNLLTATGKIQESSSASGQSKEDNIKSFLSIFPTMAQMFSGYRKHAFDKLFANKIRLDESWIRLGTPDGVKLGGGSRVKSISISDSWEEMTGGSANPQSEATNEYGQYFEYTIPDKEGNPISSGVAQNEPQIGADENPLRYAKYYPQNLPFKTDNNLFIEFPINEAYYPGATVGYRRVTTKSLATKGAMEANHQGTLTTATGITENNFYTAKEFPVIETETFVDMQPYRLPVPIPTIGEVSTTNLTASQGYAIKLNDMHGKPRSIKNFGLDHNGAKIDQPISAVNYEYQAKHRKYQNQWVYELDNVVKTLSENKIPATNGTETVATENKVLGVEYEFFADMRETAYHANSFGVNANADNIFGVPWPFPWPQVSDVNSTTRTVVLNKIIHQKGLMKKTIATDGLSTVETKNTIYDGVSGGVVMTETKNNYDAPVYSYSIPAHWEYDGMGASSKNLGLKFSADYNAVDIPKENFTITTSSIYDQNAGFSNWTAANQMTGAQLFDLLVEGDEFIIQPTAVMEVDEPIIKGTATLIKKGFDGVDYTFQFHSQSAWIVLNPTNSGMDVSGINFNLVRSGRRNLLGTNAGSILALANPLTKNRVPLGTGNYTEGEINKELVEFFNGILTCDGRLEEQEYDVENNDFHNKNGQQTDKVLSQLFDRIKIAECNSEGCWFTGGAQVGYHMELQPKGSGAYGDKCHCLGRSHHPHATDNSLPGDATHITHFSLSSGSKIETSYANMPNTIGPSGNLCYTTTTPGQYKITTQKVLAASAAEFRDSWDTDVDGDPCVNALTASLNPYADGYKGNWRPWKNYYYNSRRFQTEDAMIESDVDLSEDGVFVTYNGSSPDFSFDEFVWTDDLERPFPADRWLPNQTITQYNRHGYEVENVDISGFFSTALYGYGNNLNTAVAANANYFEIMAEGLEAFDADFVTNTATGDAIETLKAHTGARSLQVNGDSEYETRLRAQKDKTYFLSAWVSLPNTAIQTGHTYRGDDPIYTDRTGIDVKFYDEDDVVMPTGSTTYLQPTGEIIEGWQKVEGTFTTPPDHDFAKVKLHFYSNNNTPTHPSSMLWDDIRIVPNDGNMQTFVYDPAEYRLKATLDQNNFATFYEYDSQGALFLVRKETPEGIMTLQESRGHQSNVNIIP